MQESIATARLTGYANNIKEKETEVLEAMIYWVNTSIEDRNNVSKCTGKIVNYSRRYEI